jgi:hypothetical protein
VKDSFAMHDEYAWKINPSQAYSSPFGCRVIRVVIQLFQGDLARTGVLSSDDPGSLSAPDDSCFGVRSSVKAAPHSAWSGERFEQ